MNRRGFFTQLLCVAVVPKSTNETILLLRDLLPQKPVTITVNLDGKKLAEMMTRELPQPCEAPCSVA